MIKEVIAIGWDVGGWLGKKQATAVARFHNKKLEWLGVSPAFAFDKKAAPGFAELATPAVGDELAGKLRKSSNIIIGVDAPLAFPRGFLSFLRNPGVAKVEIPESEINNPLAYRDCERWINETYGKKPLSASFDKLGNNATLALSTVARLRKDNFVLIPQKSSRANRGIIEVYPGLLKITKTRVARAIPEVAAHLPKHVRPGSDEYDACLCAIIAAVFRVGGKALGLPDVHQFSQKFARDEGWIYTLDLKSMS